MKSILYRERLCQELPDLKGTLYRYVEDNGGVAYLNGYEVRADRGYLDFKQLSAPDWEQLQLELGETEYINPSLSK